MITTWTGRSGSLILFSSASSFCCVMPLESSFLPSVNSTIELTRPGSQPSCTVLYAAKHVS